MKSALTSVTEHYSDMGTVAETVFNEAFILTRGRKRGIYVDLKTRNAEGGFLYAFTEHYPTVKQARKRFDQLHKFYRDLTLVPPRPPALKPPKCPECKCRDIACHGFQYRCTNCGMLWDPPNYKP